MTLLPQHFYIMNHNSQAFPLMDYLYKIIYKPSFLFHLILFDFNFKIK